MRDAAGGVQSLLLLGGGSEIGLAVARRLVDDHNVLCMPGAMFGPDQEPYLRFAFANLEAEHMTGLAERLVARQG